MSKAPSTIRGGKVAPEDRTPQASGCVQAIEELLRTESLPNARVIVEYGATPDEQTVMVRGTIPTERAKDVLAGLSLITEQFPRMIQQPTFSKRGGLTEIFGPLI